MNSLTSLATGLTPCTTSSLTSLLPKPNTTLLTSLL